MLSSEKKTVWGLKVEVTSKEVKRLKVSLSGKKKNLRWRENKEKGEKKNTLTVVSV